MSRQFHPVQIARRIVEASGYLELGMTAQALRVLEPLPIEGPLAAPVLYLRGQAFRFEQRFDEALAPLTAAAEQFPAPADRHVWMVLSHCHFKSGNTADAVDSLAHARGAFVKPGPTRPR